MLESALRERLSLRGLVAANVAIVGLGTFYCALYCLVAFPPSHGHSMPLSHSAAWALGTFPPWVLAFEFGKRVLLSRFKPVVATVLISATMAVGAGLSIGITKALDLAFGFASMGMSPMDLAHQLPRLALTLAGVALVGWLGTRPLPSAVAATTGALPEPVMPPASQIDWIGAAGNYVEVHSGQRVLMLRMTMAQAETWLSGGRCARVHRSFIVNRDRVARAGLVGTRAWLQLADGTTLPVGTRFRHRLTSIDGN